MRSQGRMIGAGSAAPASVEREFRRYLECGILADGFAWARCPLCEHDFLVAFCCKGRWLCPSFNVWRKAETAAHLVGHVFPPHRCASGSSRCPRSETVQECARAARRRVFAHQRAFAGAGRVHPRTRSGWRKHSARPPIASRRRLSTPANTQKRTPRPFPSAPGSRWAWHRAIKPSTPKRLSSRRTL